ncbi:hypothetical protein MNEG_14088, partial [Monoraphidium neglectum]
MPHVALYIILVLYLFCSSSDHSYWASSSGRMVLALFFTQAVLGQASYRLSRWPIPENLALLALYAALAAALLCRSMRSTQAVWAEALALRAGGTPDLSPVALRMLLDFHNCTYSTEFTEHSPPDDVERAAVAAAQLLQKKLQALRRLRLQLFYDERAWMFPVGALTHCMITIPFWICELWLGAAWLGRNGLPIAFSYLFAMLAGAWLEWLLALENRPPAELSNSTRAALAAAAAELQAQAAAAAGRPMRPDDLSSNGCPPCAPGGAGCAGGARGALAPPGARRAALGAHGGFGYWRQLLRFAAWMAAVWLAWLLVLMAVTLAMRTGPGDAVSGLLGYLRLAWELRAPLVSYSLMSLGYAFYHTVGFNTVLGYGSKMREVAQSLAAALAAGSIALGFLPKVLPAAAELAPAAAVTACGALYLVFSSSGRVLERLRAARRSV